MMMRISLIVPTLSDTLVSGVAYLARQLVGTGAQVHVLLAQEVGDFGPAIEAIAPVSTLDHLDFGEDEWLRQADLYVFVCAGEHPWLIRARDIERGVVALYYLSETVTSKAKRTDLSTDPASSDPDLLERPDDVNAGLHEKPAYRALVALAPYADLIFVGSPHVQEQLGQTQLCQPERIFVVGDGEIAPSTSEAEAAYRFALGRALSQAGAWTPLREWHTDERTAGARPRATGSLPAPDVAGGDKLDPFSIALAQVRSAATVTLPNYEVRSPTPVVGPLIAWIRRNLTSHLQKPYFDPILERQERFNWQATQALEAITQQLAAQHQQNVRHPTARNATQGVPPSSEMANRLSTSAETLLEIIGKLEDTVPPARGQDRALKEQAADDASLQSLLHSLRAELEEVLAALRSQSK